MREVGLTCDVSGLYAGCLCAPLVDIEYVVNDCKVAELKVVPLGVRQERIATLKDHVSITVEVTIRLKRNFKRGTVHVSNP